MTFTPLTRDPFFELNRSLTMERLAPIPPPRNPSGEPTAQQIADLNAVIAILAAAIAEAAEDAA